MQSKPWFSKIKKVGTVFIALVTLGLPIFVMLNYLVDIREEYSNLQIWLPIHSYTAVIASALPYISGLGLLFYLYIKRVNLGKLKLFGIVFTVLVLTILIQIALGFYIISYR